MPDISRLVIEIDSNGVVKASGNLAVFAEKSKKAKLSTDSLKDSFAAFQTVVSRLPAPLQSVASLMLGLVSPAQAVAGVLIAAAEASVTFVKSSLTAFAEFESIESNLATVLGSSEKASDAIEALKVMASKTPFGLPGLADAAIQLKQTGTSMKDMTTVLRMLVVAAISLTV